MSDKLTVETVEKTIERQKKVPTEIIHFTCASCGNENDTPYIFFSIHKGRLICEDCYNQERKLAMRMLLGKKRNEWAYYRYRCTGDRKWLESEADNDKRNTTHNRA